MVEQQEFQIPQQLRELAEKSVAPARVATVSSWMAWRRQCVHGRRYRQP
jgi:hypothetical protein